MIGFVKSKHYCGTKAKRIGADGAVVSTYVLGDGRLTCWAAYGDTSCNGAGCYHPADDTSYCFLKGNLMLRCFRSFQAYNAEASYIVNQSNLIFI